MDGMVMKNPYIVLQSWMVYAMPDKTISYMDQLMSKIVVAFYLYKFPNYSPKITKLRELEGIIPKPKVKVKVEIKIRFIYFFDKEFYSIFKIFFF